MALQALNNPAAAALVAAAAAVAAAAIVCPKRSQRVHCAGKRAPQECMDACMSGRKRKERVSLLYLPMRAAKLKQEGASDQTSPS
eukprot:1161590-Pelagomonas_calceolata.AAC.8